MGDIETTLDEMSDYYEEIEKNRKAVIGAITYPAIIFAFSIVVIVFILIVIIPQFVDVYAGLGIKLNAYTQAIIDASSFIAAKWQFLLLGVIGVCITLYLLYKNVKAFRTGVQYIFMHLPVIGKIIIYNEITIFSKTFAALNKNNVMLTESIDILGKITNNEMYKLIMYDTISNLLRGEKMSESFKSNWAVPDLAYHMIATGESTGELALMLEKVADYYQVQQKSMTNQLKTFIEPIMIVFLAAIVGGIVLSIIIPLFELYKNIR
jgi:type IV pilus assembly protein PilC